MANNKIILGYPEDTPIYSNNIWIITLADLFMVLLVFFIMLNNISAADKVKQRKAVDSINKSFSKASPYNAESLKLISFPAIVDNYFNSIEALMKESLSVPQDKVMRSANKMQITISPADFFEDGQATTRGKQRNFFKQLSGVMIQNIPGAKVEANITVGSSAFSGDAINTYQLDMDRASVMAEKLVNNGVAGDMVSSGITLGGGDNIIMKFEVIKVGI